MLSLRALCTRFLFCVLGPWAGALSDARGSSCALTGCAITFGLLVSITAVGLQRQRRNLDAS